MPATAASGVDISATMGFTHTSSSAMAATATAMNSVMVLPTMAEVRLPSPAPTARAMDTVVPMARPTIITVSICITWLPTDTAVI